MAAVHEGHLVEPKASPVSPAHQAHLKSVLCALPYAKLRREGGPCPRGALRLVRKSGPPETDHPII